MADDERSGLAAGNQAAFERLYDRLGGRLYAAATRLVDRPEEAEDVVQEVFMSLARGRHALGSVRDLDAYVFTILRHAAGKRRRDAALRRRAIGEAARRAPVATEPVRYPDDALAKAVASLPEAQAEVLALKIDGGLTFAEIAVVLDLSINTVGSRYRYALARLRATLGEKPGAEEAVVPPAAQSRRSVP
jgi:RNA polymerase sigma-70 factor (ECF subfamily)